MAQTLISNTLLGKLVYSDRTLLKAITAIRWVVWVTWTKTMML